ncbi:MAG: NUDIX domain-containing protein [Patescibacteria group bacterium]|nr:NUDIX domain-containing protein [Patescibacteria group bacterium]
MPESAFGSAMPHIAAYVIFRKEGKVAFVMRANTSWMNGYYGLPSGKVENDETFTQAAIREAKEEVGVNINPEDLKCVLIAHRKSKDINWVDACFEASNWDGGLTNAEPHIHSELAWLDPNNLPENVIPSVRHYIGQISAGNSYTEFGWVGERD